MSKEKINNKDILKNCNHLFYFFASREITVILMKGGFNRLVQWFFRQSQEDGVLRMVPGKTMIFSQDKDGIVL